MTTTTVGNRAAPKSEYWRERIAEQKRSGKSVRSFCAELGIAEPSFYSWRKRLGEQQPMRFALVETGPLRPASEADLELVLANGERLRIGAGVDARTLHTVLEVLRG